MLRNLRTVRLIFPKIAPKVAQDFKEKSHESLRREKKIPQNYRVKRRGGGGAESAPPGLLRLTLSRPLSHLCDGRSHSFRDHGRIFATKTKALLRLP